MKLTKADFKAIRNWMYRNARPIDLARWQYQFENGEKDNLLSILSFYQNDDGGFGHALEADSWNPNSSPIETWTATELLAEIDFYEKDHPVIRGILAYLENCVDFKEGFWFSEIPSNNEFPHAPWWTYNAAEINEWSYNPTASLLGFILCFSDKHTRIYQESLASAEEMVKKVIKMDINNQHLLKCFINFLTYIKKADIKLKNMELYEDKLKSAVTETINKKTEEWEVSYTCIPSDLFNTPKSNFYDNNKIMADYECQFLCETRNAEGVWNISWNWAGQYDREFYISENWWKSDLVVKYMIYLRNFNYLEDIK